MAELTVAALLTASFFMKKAVRKNCFTLPVLVFVAFVPQLASAEKRILIEVTKAEKTAFKRLTAGSQSSGTEDVNVFGARIWGKMLDIGRENNVDGRMHLLPANCAEDEGSFARLPDGWVAVLNYTEKLAVSTGGGTVGECPSVVERMKRALMFGASAIIILTLNPKIIKEIDLSQMFSKPVALVDISENITNMLNLLSSKMRLKTRFLYNIVKDIQNSQDYFTTVTLWGTCGRYSGRSYHEWDGVVCLGEDKNTNKEGKVDQENFWNYFYTGILFLMMMHYIRTRRGQNWEDPDYIDETLRQIAYQALAVMKIKRYSPDGTNDTCAICLEKFFLKQKLRVLPCGHYFHTKCVDPWLVRSHTCPLCKLNVIEKLES